MLRGACALAAACLWLLASSCAQTPSKSALELVRETVNNEVAGRQSEPLMLYHVDKTVEGKRTEALQIETAEGPLHKVLRVEGHPLTADQRRADTERIQNLVRNPSLEAKTKRQHDEDQTTILQIMKLLPQAFLYDYDGTEGGEVRLRFRPNPDFQPPTLVSRALQGLAGTVLIEPHQERLLRISGTFINEVEFGYGLLGHINKGGTMRIERVQVNPRDWRTDLVDIHISARLLFFKTISRQQREARSDFQPVPENITLAQAAKVLADAPDQ